MRNFELETYFSKWEFTAKYHMTASDVESHSVDKLLAMANPDDRKAYDTLWLGYTETWGAPDLRAEIAGMYDNIKDENILCFAGAGEGIYIAMRTLLTANDHAIVIVPNYQSAETIPLQICEVTGVALDADKNWALDLDKLRDAIQPNTKLISINFPHNPTGAVLPKNQLQELIETCRQHDIWLFSDEVYRGIELDPDVTLPHVADVYEKGLSLNVMSKSFGLPGLRVGWIASQNIAALQTMERYKHYLSICNSGPSERLAVIAIKNRDVIWNRNREILQKNLIQLEKFFDDFSDLFDWQRPQGGCVAYPRFKRIDGGEAFCKRLVEERGVLLLPSSIYRSELMDAPVDHFRIGYGRAKLFQEGLDEIREFVEKNHTNLRP